MILYVRFENREREEVESGDWGSSGTISLVQRRRHDGRDGRMEEWKKRSEKAIEAIKHKTWQQRENERDGGNQLQYVLTCNHYH